MRHSLPLAPQFYVTAPQPCPYLEGRMERKLFTALQGEQAERLNDALSKQGFRRSQNVLYRPSCAECSACLSARIRVADFTPSRSQRRIRRRNGALRRRIGARPESAGRAGDDERHGGGGGTRGRADPAHQARSAGGALRGVCAAQDVRGRLGAPLRRLGRWFAWQE